MDFTITEQGEGRPFLLLHGGAGPRSVAGFAALLAEHARVFTPVHPGFGGTPRPDDLRTIGQLAELYLGWLEERDLRDVTVIGNSIGGWIAAELALRGPERLARVVLVDAVGIEVPGHPVADFFSLTLDEVAQRSYFRPEALTLDPAAVPEMAGNREALAVYGGAMTDPGLAARLAGVAVPVLVVWGEADRIADPDYGRAYAAAIPGAEFVLLAGTGHVPQIETPELLLRAIT